ncbi:hypothetical protein [Candidatus Nitrospira bockiana]
MSRVIPQVTFVILVLMLLVSGCAFTQTPTQTVRSATEQLLLSSAVERSLTDLTLPLPEDSSVALEVAGFAVPPVTVASADLTFVREAVAGRLGELGFRVRSRPDEATYLGRIMIQALGTVQGETFFGMPAVQSVLIPFALPELTLYKRQIQHSHMRFWIDLYEQATGRFVRSTPWHIGSAYYNQYTILFLITFYTTDLIEPP